jgi:hypothetical protein
MHEAKVGFKMYLYNLMRILIFIGILFLNSSSFGQILPSFGGSRSGTTGMQFLKLGVDARSSGMSGNVVASVNDISSLWWNPAGLAALDTAKFHLMLAHTQYFANIPINALGFVKQHKGNVFGISIFSLNSGSMPVTTEFQPFGTGQSFSVNDMVLGLSYAKSLTRQFNFGVTGKYARENIAGLLNQNLVVDLGFQYDIGWQNTRFAVTISNFGINNKPTGNWVSTTLSGPITQSDFEQLGIPAVFRFGVAWDAVKKSDQILTATAQLNHPTDNKETFGLGLEYQWKGILYARTGYEFGIEEAFLPSFGTGLYFPRNFGKVKLDYGFNSRTRLGYVHRLTLQFALK